MANGVKIDKLKLIFSECINEWAEKSNFQFNPLVKHADVLLKPRVSYITEVLRQLAEISADKGCVAVVDHDLLPFIEQAWKKELPRKLRPLQGMLNLTKAEEKAQPGKKESFIEFVEKQVILDVLFDPFV